MWGIGMGLLWNNVYDITAFYNLFTQRWQKTPGRVSWIAMNLLIGSDAISHPNVFKINSGAAKSSEDTGTRKITSFSSTFMTAWIKTTVKYSLEKRVQPARNRDVSRYFSPVAPVPCYPLASQPLLTTLKQRGTFPAFKSEWGQKRRRPVERFMSPTQQRLCQK